MKLRFGLLLAVFLISSMSGLFADDIGGGVRIGNLEFPAVETQTDMGTNYLWGLSAVNTQNISSEVSVESGYVYDPILRSTFRTLVNYQQGLLELGIGPFFGLFNNLVNPLKLGITVHVKLVFPGIAFIAFQADSSIGGNLIETGDYFQEQSDTSLGFYVYNAICSINMFTKKYTQKTATGRFIDSQTEYAFIADMYQKNVPYQVSLKFSYMDQERTIFTGDTGLTYGVGSIIVGTRIDVDILPFLTLTLDADSSVYNFGLNKLLGQTSFGPLGFLFMANAALVVHTDMF